MTAIIISPIAAQKRINPRIDSNRSGTGTMIPIGRMGKSSIRAKSRLGISLSSQLATAERDHEKYPSDHQHHAHACKRQPHPAIVPFFPKIESQKPCGPEKAQKE
jgi:hypothetical protein